MTDLEDPKRVDLSRSFHNVIIVTLSETNITLKDAGLGVWLEAFRGDSESPERGSPAGDLLCSRTAGKMPAVIDVAASTASRSEFVSGRKDDQKGEFPPTVKDPVRGIRPVSDRR